MSPNLGFKFFIFNLIGGGSWVLLFTMGGYFFGNIPQIQKNFELVIIGIVIVSFLPTVIEYIKHKKTV